MQCRIPSILNPTRHFFVCNELADTLRSDMLVTMPLPRVCEFCSCLVFTVYTVRAYCPLCSKSESTRAPVGVTFCESWPFDISWLILSCSFSSLVVLIWSSVTCHHHRHLILFTKIWTSCTGCFGPLPPAVRVIFLVTLSDAESQDDIC